MIEHQCHAYKCGRPVPREMFMCRRHWKMLPGLVKCAVLTNYRPGQCDDLKPSRAYLEAAKRAIAYVRQQEQPDGV